MKIDLSQRVAVVTGATGDLGRVISKALVGCGAKVAIHYNSNADKANELVKQLPGCFAVQADVTDATSINTMRDKIVERFGHVDIIVNNAVVQYEPKLTVMEQSVEDYESQYKSCVLHNVLMIKAFVPAMVQKKWGRVIGISTECAMLYNELHSAYVSGKRGMDGVLRVLAREVGPHEVTVNQVAPGFMISDRERAMNRVALPGYDEHVPMKRRGYDEDIANAVAFLSSDLAKFITGAYLPVCGGHIMPAI